MSVRARNVRGNTVLYNTNPLSVFDAWGPDVVKFFDDFTHSPVAADAIAGYTVTLVEAGAGESTITNPDASGGRLLFTTAGDEDDGINFQKVGELFGMATTNYLTYFGARFQASEATQLDWLIGLCVANTTLLGGMTDGVYFEKLDGGTGISFVTEKDSAETQTDALATFAADTDITVEFCWVAGQSVRAMINGTVVATHTLTVPDNELLTPSLHVLNGAAAVETLSLDWWRAVQIGR